MAAYRAVGSVTGSFALVPPTNTSLTLFFSGSQFGYIQNMGLLLAGSPSWPGGVFSETDGFSDTYTANKNTKVSDDFRGISSAVNIEMLLTAAECAVENNMNFINYTSAFMKVTGTAAASSNVSTLNIAGFTSGLCDCGYADGKTVFNVYPAPAGGLPAQNVVTVRGGIRGCDVFVKAGLSTLNGHPVRVGVSDGSSSKFIYQDQMLPYLGDSTSTGYTHITLESNVSADIGQLTGGNLCFLGTVPVGQQPGKYVQDKSGSWITLNPATTGIVNIEALAMALTWIDGANFNGKLTLTLDGSVVHSVTNVTIGGVPAAFISSTSNPNGSGLGFYGTYISGMTAAQVIAKLTNNGPLGPNYLIIH